MISVDAKNGTVFVVLDFWTDNENLIVEAYKELGRELLRRQYEPNPD